jgi:hypothetical protein
MLSESRQISPPPMKKFPLIDLSAVKIFLQPTPCCANRQFVIVASFDEKN